MLERHVIVGAAAGGDSLNYFIQLATLVFQADGTLVGSPFSGVNHKEKSV